MKIVYSHIALTLMTVTCVLLAGCRRTAVEEDIVPKAPIYFTYADGTEHIDRAPARRAPGTIDAEILFTSFRVWVTKTVNENRQIVMSGYRTNWDNIGNAWDYQNANLGQYVKYWDLSASEYRFFASAPCKPNDSDRDSIYYDTSKTLLNTTYSTIRYYLDGKSASPDWYYSDLTRRKHSEIVSGIETPVLMTFRQPWAKVRFMFLFPDGITRNMMAITNIKFHPITGDESYLGTAAKGRVEVAYPMSGSGEPKVKWTAGTRETDKQLMTEDYWDENKKWYYYVPQETQAAYTLLATINTLPKSAVVPAAYMSWRPGHAYTYIFKVSDTSVIFEQVIDVYDKWQVGYSQETNW